ncbi:hypothetical protein GYB22_07525 [bacterium]|nr:hypothetical protein [bacterium]
MKFFQKLISFILILSTVSFAKADDGEWHIHSIEDFNFFYQGEKADFVDYLRPQFKSELYKLQNSLNYHLNGKVDIMLVENSRIADQLGSEYVIKDGNQGGTLIDKIDKIVINVYDEESKIVSDFKSQLVLLILQEMIYGSTFQDRVKSANLFYLPSWVIPGITLYLRDQWSPELDNRWRLVYERYGIENFSAVPDEYDAIKGASFWKFLTDEYGESAISTVLYMTRLTRKFNSALYFSFQKTSFELFKEWREYYHTAYLFDQQKRMPVNGILLSDQKTHDLYVAGEHELYTVDRHLDGYALTLHEHEKTKTIFNYKKEDLPLAGFKGGLIKQADVLYSFVLKNGEYGVYKYHSGKLKYYQLKIPGIEKVWVQNDQLYVLSSSVLKSTVFAIKETKAGLEPQKLFEKSDVFIRDFAFSDHGAIYFLHSQMAKGVLVSEVEGIQDTLLKMNGNIRQMIKVDKLLYFNCNLNGVYNGMVLNLETGELVYLTDYRADILYHQVNEKFLAEYVSNLGESSLFITESIPYDEYFRYDTLIPTYLFSRSSKETSKVITDEYVISEDSLPDYIFQSPVPPEMDFTLSNYDSLKQVADYLNNQNATISISPELYRPKLFYFQFYNELPVTRDVPFGTAIPSYGPNQLGVRLGAGFENQFNTKKIELSYYGFRIWTNRDVVFKYTNTAKLPFSIRFLHRQRLSFESRSRTDLFKNGTNLIGLNWRVLAGNSWRVNHDIAARLDIRNPLVTDDENLQQESEQKYFLQNRLNFHFGVNQAEQGRPQPLIFSSDLSVEPLYDLSNQKYALTTSLSAQLEKTFRPWFHMFVRGSAGNSVGTQPLFFVLGGTSADLLANFENREFSSYKPASLYRMIYGVRGFPINYRNGNTYGVLNAELRFKFLELVYKRPIVSELFDHLQFVVFGDIGSSMYGTSILDPANALNSRTFDSRGSSLTIEVRNIKNPMIGCIGWGLHTKIYSYTLRADLAYGIENSSLQKSMLHLSLGYGF